MKAIPIISIRENRTDFHPTITQAAAFYQVSNYTVINAVFTGDPLPDGTCFDLDLSVTDSQERRLRRAWLNSKSSSSGREELRRLIDGKPEEEL
jgi:hypothetical protein